MSWVNDLVSSLGIPAGAATLAVAIYAGCAAAEKIARPEALKEIARVLKDPSWERSVRPSAIIERLFIWTFGERHLSWECVESSSTTSLLVCFYVAMTFHMVGGTRFQPVESLRMAVFGSDFPTLTPSLLNAFLQLSVGFVLMAVLPDYIALAKARLLLKHIRDIPGITAMPVLVLIDAALSALISFAFVVVIYHVAFTLAHGFPSEVSGFFLSLVTGVTSDMETNYRMMLLSITDGIRGQDEIIIFLNGMIGPFSRPHDVWSLLPVFLLSTLFTSIWITLVFISTATLKLLAPVHRFTAWFFDVDKHPVKAVAGALVMIGSFIWTIVRAVI